VRAVKSDPANSVGSGLQQGSDRVRRAIEDLSGEIQDFSVTVNAGLDRDELRCLQFSHISSEGAAEQSLARIDALTEATQELREMPGCVRIPRAVARRVGQMQLFRDG
jgi:hypothetical protein